MALRLAADLTLLVHLAFVLFVIFGALLALRWRRAPWLHLPTLAWGVFIEVSGRVCPLTPLENHFRLAAGEAGYTGGFIEHYLLALLYPDGLTRPVQWMLAGGLVAINLAIYLWVLRRRATSTPH